MIFSNICLELTIFRCLDVYSGVYLGAYLALHLDVPFPASPTLPVYALRQNIQKVGLICSVSPISKEVKLPVASVTPH